MYDEGLWHEDDGFFYDVLKSADGHRVPMRVRSMVGLLPLCATTTLGTATLRALPRFAERYRWFVANRPEAGAVVGQTHVRDGAEGRQRPAADERIPSIGNRPLGPRQRAQQGAGESRDPDQFHHRAFTSGDGQ